MTLLAFAPVVIAAVLWAGLWRINRDQRFLSIGEVIFWDAILLILVQLVWLRWF
jgi:hypothetical protein